MEDIPLDPGPAEDDLANSRPIGGDEGSKLHRVYYSTDVLSMEEERRQIKHVNLTHPSLEVHPGVNTIVVSGKVSVWLICLSAYSHLQCTMSVILVDGYPWVLLSSTRVA